MSWHQAEGNFQTFMSVYELNGSCWIWPSGSGDEDEDTKS